MATSIDWRKNLTGHPILEPLSKFKEKLTAIDDCKRWLAAKDGELFIWNPNDASILTTNLKHSALKTGGRDRAAEQGHQYHTQRHEPESESSSLQKFQTLTLTRLPINEVERIVFSPSGTYLALISRNELLVVLLPQRWGRHGLYNNGQDRVLCKSIVVGERLLLSVGLKLLHAEWHPGSLDDSHITMLTSDNQLRTFDIHNPAVPVETMFICTDGNSSIAASNLSIQRALGDTVVSFDFGQVTETQNKSNELSSSRKPKCSKVWPIFVLCGNGDVYQAFSTLGSSRSPKPTVHGPLSMYPPAEDNYGTDACAILCLPGSPELLVVVTLDGKLYHCVVLSSGKKDSDNNLNLTTSQDGGEIRSSIEPPASSLYVYEEVQIELALTSLNCDYSYSEGGCLMQLEKDTLRPDRYFCAHSAGLHCVTLPWLCRIKEFAESSNDNEELPKLSSESNALVEHLFCTRLAPSSPSAPPFGTCLLFDKLLGTALISLTNSLELISLPLRGTDPGPVPTLLSEQSHTEIVSPRKQLHKESFEMHIQEILQRDNSQPILRMAGDTDINPESCLQILSDAVRILREQYIHKLVYAREDIGKKMSLLRQQRIQQDEDLRLCKDTRAALNEQATELAEKYQAANDFQDDLVLRLETILKKLYARLPTLTEAERSMQKELKNIEEKLKIYKSNIKQVKMKQNYQSKQIEQSSQRPRSSSSSKTHFSKSQQQHLRTLLQKEGDSIADLVQQMGRLKASADA